MSLILAALFALGVFLVYLSCWNLPPRSRKSASAPALQQLLRQADLEKLSLKMFYLISAFLALASAFVAFLLTSLLPLALISGLVGLCAPRVIVSQRAHRRQAQMRTLWPDAVDHLRSAIRAGMALPDALMQLQYRGPEPLRPAFAFFASDYRASGEFVPALNRLKDKLSDPTADNIIEALKVTREVGGTDLGRLLGTLSSFLRENARTRAELEARQSWTINAARLACVAPWVVLGLMATQPSTIRIYNSLAGFLVLASGFLLTFLAYRLMMRIGALPQEKRVLV